MTHNTRYRDPRRTENIALGLIARGERQRQAPAKKIQNRNEKLQIVTNSFYRDKWRAEFYAR